MSQHVAASFAKVARARVLMRELNRRDPCSQKVSAKSDDKLRLVESIVRDRRDIVGSRVSFAYPGVRHGLVDDVLSVLELTEELCDRLSGRWACYRASSKAFATVSPS